MSPGWTRRSGRPVLNLYFRPVATCTAKSATVDLWSCANPARPGFWAPAESTGLQMPEIGVPRKRRDRGISLRRRNGGFQPQGKVCALLPLAQFHPREVFAFVSRKPGVRFAHRGSQGDLRLPLPPFPCLRHSAPPRLPIPRHRARGGRSGLQPRREIIRLRATPFWGSELQLRHNQARPGAQPFALFYVFCVPVLCTGNPREVFAFAS
jgi:hypothetical protein